MPHGYHFYKRTTFDAAVKRPVKKSNLELSARKQAAGITGGYHEITYLLPKDEEVLAGGNYYPNYELPYRGYIWLTSDYAILEIRSEIVHRLGKVLNKLDGISIARLAIPNLNAIYSKLPPKVEISTQHPDLPDRSRITVRGRDIDRNARNREELRDGRLKHVEFLLNGRPALVYDGATVMLRNAFEPEIGAAMALEIWQLYLADSAEVWRPKRPRRRR